MIINGRFDHDALISIGAKYVVYNNQNDQTTVLPDIDVSGYANALALLDAIRNNKAAKSAEIAQTKADTSADKFVQQFVNMTPEQLIAYVNSNVSNLADAKQLLSKLALMMLSIAKEQYK